MKNIVYVKFCYESYNPRHQIFKEIGEEKYYGRDHFLLWHTIHIDNKQLILEMVVPKQLKFVICDDEKRELITSSNHNDEMNFPLLRYKSLAEWNTIRKNTV